MSRKPAMIGKDNSVQAAASQLLARCALHPLDALLKLRRVLNEIPLRAAVQTKVRLN